MPQLGGVGGGDEAEGGWRAGACGELVEGPRTIAAYDHAPSAKILNGKTERVKFHRYIIINGKLASRD
jgi:hypothetical protein